MPFDIGAATDVGRRRSSNEDALEVLQLTNGTLCVVADGMGGHQAGEIASRLAVRAIREALAQHPPTNPPPVPEALAKAIRSANEAVFEESVADSSKQGMGTTVVCALLENGRAQLANVGDSPAFLVRDQQVARVTQDHSWVAEEIARGALGPDEAATHPYRHVLTRSLGAAEQVEVEVYPPVELQAGEVLILCSDGLSEHVLPDDLPAAVSGRSAQAAAESLVALANERGGSDNISVIVARYQ
jgi:serine/threonine protein phosphatase PrpC